MSNDDGETLKGAGEALKDDGKAIKGDKRGYMAMGMR